jgi:TonB family protein
MMHLDEGTIQTFLDDELPARERAAVAAHIVECPACRAVHDELARVRSTFSASIPVLDVASPPTPLAAVRAARRSARILTPSLARAAVLVLVLAAAAAAAVPGSPVRQWLVNAPEPAPQAPPAASGEPAVQPSAPAMVGVEGSVRGRDDRPLAFAQVHVVGDTVSGWTDEMGLFRLGGRPGERWQLRVTHPGYRSVERTVLLPDAGSLDMELRLEAIPGPIPDPLSLFEPFQIAYTLPALLNAPEVTAAIQRIYPPHLVDARVGGETVLRLWLDEEGRVARSMVSVSSGNRELDALALRVSRDMRFRPAKNRGEEVRVIVQIPVIFTADGADSGSG